MTITQPRISVLICTWNRPDGLRAALQGLTAQTLPSNQFEVIAVDNNSTDNTREVVGSMAATAPYPLNYVLETRQGKCWALNTGIDAARGDIIVCLDDDCVPEPDWLTVIDGAFQDPEIGIMGGPCLSVFPESVLADSYRLFLANRFFGDFAPYDRLTEIRSDNLPLGMNLAFRKKVADSVRFDVRLGPRPKAHLGREETGFIRSAQRASFRVFYTPDAVVRHHVEERRISWEAVRKQAFFSGMGICRERYSHTATGPAYGKLGLTLIFAGELIYSTIRRGLFAVHPRKAVVARFRAAAALGKLTELWSPKKAELSEEQTNTQAR